MNTTAVIVLPEWIVWMAAALIILCMFNEIAALYLSWMQRKLSKLEMRPNNVRTK